MQILTASMIVSGLDVDDADRATRLASINASIRGRHATLRIHDPRSVASPMTLRPLYRQMQNSEQVRCAPSCGHCGMDTAPGCANASAMPQWPFPMEALPSMRYMSSSVVECVQDMLSAFRKKQPQPVAEPVVPGLTGQVKEVCPVFHNLACTGQSCCAHMCV